MSWVPHFLDRLDYTYTDRMPPSKTTLHRPTGATPWSGSRRASFPATTSTATAFLGFQEDALGIRDRNIIGVDNLMWGADYPHAESTFPRSREILDNILADCTEEEKAKIAGGNAQRVYRL